MKEIVKNYETVAFAMIAIGYFIMLGITVVYKITKQKNNTL